MVVLEKKAEVTKLVEFGNGGWLALCRFTTQVLEVVYGMPRSLSVRGGDRSIGNVASLNTLSHSTLHECVVVPVTDAEPGHSNHC